MLIKSKVGVITLLHLIIDIDLSYTQVGFIVEKTGLLNSELFTRGVIFEPYGAICSIGT